MPDRQIGRFQETVRPNTGGPFRSGAGANMEADLQRWSELRLAAPSNVLFQLAALQQSLAATYSRLGYGSSMRHPEIPPVDRSCIRYKPSHQVHFIHARKSSEPQLAIDVTVAVNDDGSVEIEGNDFAIVLWNHDAERLNLAWSQWRHAVWTPRSRWLSGRLIPSRRSQDLFAGWWQLIHRLGAVRRVLLWDGEGAIGRWRGGRTELVEDRMAKSRMPTVNFASEKLVSSLQCAVRELYVQWNNVQHRAIIKPCSPISSTAPGAHLLRTVRRRPFRLWRNTIGGPTTACHAGPTEAKRSLGKPSRYAMPIHRQGHRLS